MGTVKRLAEEVKYGLREARPGLRKTVIKKLALSVGTMIEGQTPTQIKHREDSIAPTPYTAITLGGARF